MNIEDRLAGLRRSDGLDVEPAVALATGLADGFREYASPVGPVVVTFNVTGISSVGLTHDAEDRFEDATGRRLLAAVPPSGWDRKIGRAVEEGRPGDLPLDLRSVGEFQQTILRLTATIPRGEVRPYGWLAREAGNPKAVRAVGTAMARNPVPLIVPCHRVVRSDGTIGNYSLGGSRNKIVLLEGEGHDLAALRRFASRGVRYLGSRQTGIYCLPTCRISRSTTATDRIELRTIDAAVDLGMKPCRTCRP